MNKKTLIFKKKSKAEARAPETEIAEGTEYYCDRNGKHDEKRACKTKPNSDAAPAGEKLSLVACAVTQESEENLARSVNDDFEQLKLNSEKRRDADARSTKEPNSSLAACDCVDRTDVFRSLMTESISANPTNISPIKSHRETLENRTAGCDAEVRGTKNSLCVKAANSARSRIASKQIESIAENNEKLQVFELDQTHLKIRI